MSPWGWSVVGFFAGTVVGVFMLHVAWWRERMYRVFVLRCPHYAGHL